MTVANFGTELQRLRLAAGLSLGDLAKRVYYSRGHLSKVENGLKGPSPELARACDAIFGGDGLLISHAAVEAPAGEPGPTIVATDLGDLGFYLPADGPLTLELAGQPITFARLSTFGSSADLGAIFDATRRWGRAASPGAVLSAITVHLGLVRMAAGQTLGEEHHRQVALAARMSEFAGWMAQEAGDNVLAARLTDQAERLARDAGLTQMQDHVLVRRALIAMYEGRPADTIELSVQARTRPGATPRMRWLAALREAQGFALAGDRRGCLLALDRAAELEPQVGGAEDASLGPGADPAVHAAVTRAWCLHDLGRYAEAADLFDAVVPAIPADSARSFARYAARRALSHAAAGRPDRVGELLPEVLDQAARADSETVRSDLHVLARVTRRWPDDQVLLALRPRLTAELARSVTRPGGVRRPRRTTGHGA
jgi:transcriptional regulator with XRE-family HTH domain/tetratricopeptide (TPR) repeat protein